MAEPHTVTRLFLVRHGATTATEEDRFSGSTAAELSEQGRWQAARLGERLSRQHITAIYASPLSRALETARIVAGHCGLEPVARDGLREIGHGHWEGMKRDDVEREFASEYEAWQADPFTFAPVGGESGVAVLARALPVIRELVTAHSGGQVVVVSHKATLRLVLSSLLAFAVGGTFLSVQYGEMIWHFMSLSTALALLARVEVPVVEKREAQQVAVTPAFAR